MFNADLVREATARWCNAPSAAQPLESLLVAHGDSPELRDQRQKRIARLSNIASTAKAEALARAADASPVAGSQANVLSSIGYERVIGTRDLLGVDFLELAIAIARGIGRVRCDNEYATGVLVGPRLMMTNNHVIDDTNVRDGWVIDMDYQENSSGQMLSVQTYKVDPNYFFYTNKNLDYTIIGLADTSDKGTAVSSYPWMKMLADTGKLEVGDPINIIQHPNGGLKQIAFRENKVIALTTAQPDFLDYTTDTEPGSSGSGCFNDQWELVALHHSGVAKQDAQGHILTTQNQVWKQGQDDPSTIDWIGNEGVRISAIVNDLSAATLSAEFRILAQAMLSQDPPNPIELARASRHGTSLQPQPTPAENTKEIAMGSGSVSFQLPLIITVSLGPTTPANINVPPAPTGAPVPLPAPVPPAPAEEAVTIDPDWKSRPGYDPAFLGEGDPIPLPVLSNTQLKTTVQVSPEYRGTGDYAQYELRYWNYSVLMNRVYRTAWFSAANVDGDERYTMPPRSGDKWFSDPRIGADQQLDQKAFEPGIDRGHLTRREDAAWGATKDIATKSTNDTFHFTNCSLQASPFNRGKDRWQGLEQFLLEQHAKKDKRRMMVITGPVFDPKNPTYRNDKMTYSVPCPLQFWKVCVLIRESDGQLSATGFILGQQDIAQLSGFEAFDVGAAQITLQQLEQKTGLSFGDLKQYDHFAQTGETGTLEKVVLGGKQRFLHTFDDIVV
jgi:endonuclease G